LLEKLQKNAAFKSFEASEIASLLSYMIKADYVEDLKRELIVGYEGEKLTNHHDFYSMFTSTEMFKVIHAGNKIGDIDVSPMVIVDANILLAAKIWKIKDVDYEAKKIQVIPTNDGKRPKFLGEVADVHPRIRQKMLELIYSEIDTKQSDIPAVACLEELQFDFKEFIIEDLLYDRPVIQKKDGFELYTFTGTKINKTILFLLQQAGIDAELDWHGVFIDIPLATDQLIPILKQGLELLEQHVSEIMEDTPERFQFSKWGQYLPIEMKKESILNNAFDVKGTWEFVNGLRMVYSSVIATPEKLQEEL
jgi:ATP-dependent Lhr-like helicase